jgi:arylformamidase
MDDPAPTLKFRREIEKGFEYNLSEITLCPHNATHIDAPLHYSKDAEDVSKISLDKCFGSCKVVNERYVSLSDAERLCKNTKRLIFKGNVDISLPAASLMAKKLELLGVEKDTVGDRSVHLALLRGGVVVLENLDLSDAPEGDYLICSLPLKMKGAEASPCRTVLITE